MLVRLLLVLIVVPIAEVWVLLEVYRAIAARTSMATGLAITIGLVVLTGIVGTIVARIQGAGVARRMLESMRHGQVPGDALIDGAMIFVGAVLLILPGFLTDILGLTFLIPITRKVHQRLLAGWIRRKVDRGEIVVRAYHGGPHPGAGESLRADHPMIDVTPVDRREGGA